MPAAIRRILALLAASVCGGCVGVSTYSDHTFTLNAPSLGAAGDLRAGPVESPMTRDEALAGLGEPDRIDREADGIERWTYSSGHVRWNGVVPFVLLIPIPLMLPTGNERLVVTFRGDRAVAAEDTHHVSKTGLLGLSAGMCGPRFGAFGYASGCQHEADGMRVPAWMLERREREPRQE